MLYLQGSWDTTEISVEPIRFLVSLKSKGGGFTYFLSYLKVNTLSSFLFLSCLFRWIHNLLIRHFDSLDRQGYKCTNVSDVQLKLCCEPHSTLFTTDNVLCVNCSAESRAGLAGAGEALEMSRPDSSSQLWHLITFKVLLKYKYRVLYWHCPFFKSSVFHHVITCNYKRVSWMFNRVG